MSCNLGDVELGRQPSDTISLLQPCIPYKGSHNLNVETSPIFGGMADTCYGNPYMYLASFTLGENKIEFGECLSVELCEYPSLSCSGFYLQKSNTFHSLDQKYLARKIYKDYANNSTIHPTRSMVWASLSRLGDSIEKPKFIWQDSIAVASIALNDGARISNQHRKRENLHLCSASHNRRSLSRRKGDKYKLLHLVSHGGSGFGNTPVLLSLPAEKQEQKRRMAFCIQHIYADIRADGTA